MTMFETFTMNMLGFIGWFLMIPVTHQMMKMADSMNSYSVKETCDVYLLCDRVGDLENEMRGIKQLIQDIKEDVDKELHKEYVDALQYNREKQQMKDGLDMTTQDIIQLKEQMGSRRAWSGRPPPPPATRLPEWARRTL
jgi:hypothetical protein